MSDARTEAHRRFTDVLVAHQRDTPGSCTCGWGEWGKRFSDHIVDLLLDLFPEVSWGHLGSLPLVCLPPGMAPDGEYRRLHLRGPVEPVIPEEPQ